MRVVPGRVCAIYFEERPEHRQAAQEILEAKLAKYGAQAPDRVPVGVLARGFDGVRALQPRSGDAIYLVGRTLERRWVAQQAPDGPRMTSAHDFADALWKHAGLGQAVVAHVRGRERSPYGSDARRFDIRLRFRTPAATAGAERSDDFLRDCVQRLGRLANDAVETLGYPVGPHDEIDDSRLSREAIDARWSVLIKATRSAPASRATGAGATRPVVHTARVDIDKFAGDPCLQLEVSAEELVRRP